MEDLRQGQPSSSDSSHFVEDKLRKTVMMVSKTHPAEQASSSDSQPADASWQGHTSALLMSHREPDNSSFYDGESMKSLDSQLYISVSPKSDERTHNRQRFFSGNPAEANKTVGFSIPEVEDLGSDRTCDQSDYEGDLLSNQAPVNTILTGTIPKTPLIPKVTQPRNSTNETQACNAGLLKEMEQRERKFLLLQRQLEDVQQQLQEALAVDDSPPADVLPAPPRLSGVGLLNNPQLLGASAHPPVRPPAVQLPPDPPKNYTADWVKDINQRRASAQPNLHFLEGSRRAPLAQSAQPSSARAPPPPSPPGAPSQPPPAAYAPSSTGQSPEQKIRSASQHLMTISRDLQKPDFSASQIKHMLKLAEKASSKLSRYLEEFEHDIDEVTSELAYQALADCSVVEMEALARIDELEKKALQARNLAQSLPKAKWSVWKPDNNGSFEVTYWGCRQQLSTVLSTFGEESQRDLLWSSVWSIIPPSQQETLKIYEIYPNAGEGLKQLLAHLDRNFGSPVIQQPKLENKLTKVRWAKTHTDLAATCKSYSDILINLKVLAATQDPTLPLNGPPPAPYKLSKDLFAKIWRGILPNSIPQGVFQQMWVKPEEDLLEEMLSFLHTRGTEALLQQRVLSLSTKSEEQSTPKPTKQHAQQTRSAQAPGRRGRDGNGAPPPSLPGAPPPPRSSPAPPASQPPPEKKKPSCNFCKTAGRDAAHWPHTCSHISPQTNVQHLLKASICFKCLQSFSGKTEAQHNCDVRTRQGVPFSPTCLGCLRHRRLCKNGGKCPPSTTTHRMKTSYQKVTDNSSMVDLIPLTDQPPEEQILPMIGGVGKAQPLVSRLRLAFQEGVKTRYVYVKTMFDSCSLDSFLSPNIIPFSLGREDCSFNLMTAVGNWQEEEGDRYHVKFLDDNDQWYSGSSFLNADLDKSEAFSLPTKWLSVPISLATKYNLEQHDCYVGSTSSDIIIALPSTNVDLVAGLNWRAMFPVFQEEYSDEHGSFAVYRDKFSSQFVFDGARSTLSAHEVESFNNNLPAHLKWNIQEFNSFLLTSKTKYLGAAPPPTAINMVRTFIPKEESHLEVSSPEQQELTDLEIHGQALPPASQAWLAREETLPSLDSHHLHPDCRECRNCKTCKLTPRGKNLRTREMEAFYREQVEIKSNPDGTRYFLLHYTWIDNQLAKLPLNSELALKRLYSLDKAMKRQPPDARQEFLDRIRAGERQGFWKQIQPEDIPVGQGKATFIPVNFALRETSSSTPIRPILDPTLKAAPHLPSANDCQASPLNLQVPIQKIILNATSAPFLIQCDIQKYFYNLHITPEDSMKSLWYFHRNAAGELSIGNEEEEVIVMANLRSVVGWMQTPCLATICIQHIGKVIAEGGDGPHLQFDPDPVLAKRLVDNTYADDCESFLSFEEAQALYAEGGLPAIIHHLASCAAKIEATLRHFSLKSKGWNIVAPLEGQLDPELFDHLVSAKVDLILAGKPYLNEPASFQLPDNIDCPLLTPPATPHLSQSETRSASGTANERACSSPSSPPSSLLSQSELKAARGSANRKAASLPSVPPSSSSTNEGTAFDLHAAQSSASLLGWTLTPDDKIILGKTDYINLTKTRRGIKDPKSRLYSGKDFLDFAAQNPIRYRTCLSLIHNLYDPLGYAQPLTQTGNTLYRRCVLLNANQKTQSLGAAKRDFKKAANKGSLQPLSSSSDSPPPDPPNPPPSSPAKKGTLGVKYDTLVDKSLLPQLANFVDAVLRVKTKAICPRYHGAPLYLHSVVYSLIILADGVHGIEGGSGAQAFCHYEGLTPDGEVVTGFNFIKAKSYLNSAFRMSHQVDAEINGLTTATDLRIEVLDFTSITYSRCALGLDSTTSIQMILSLSMAFDMRIGLAIAKAQRHWTPQEIFHLPGNLMIFYADKLCRPQADPDLLLGDHYLGGGPMDRPFDKLPWTPSSELSSFELRSLPYVNRKSILVAKPPGQSTITLTMMTRYKEQNLMAPDLCTRPCVLCSSSNPLPAERTILNCNRTQQSMSWVGAPPNEAAHLRINEEIFNLSNPGLRITPPASCEVPSQLEVKTTLPFTILHSMKVTSLPTVTRREANRPLPRQPHSVDLNPFQYVFASSHCGNRALKALATCLQWVYLFKGKPVPSLFSRIRHVTIKCLQFESQAAVQCKDRLRRGATSDYIWLVRHNILWRQERALLHPVFLSTDQAAFHQLDVEAEHQAFSGPHSSARSAKPDSLEPTSSFTPVLCGNSAFAHAMMRSYHDQYHNAAIDFTQTSLLRQWAVLHSRPYLKAIKDHCVTCTMNNPSPLQLQMAPFPLDFSTMEIGAEVIIDYFGPYLLDFGLPKSKARSTRANPSSYRKVWVLTGIDLYTRGIQAVLVPSLTSADFLAAFKALTARMGTPKVRISMDKASTFMGALPALRSLADQSGEIIWRPETEIEGYPESPTISEALTALQKSGYDVDIPEPISHAPHRQGACEKSAVGGLKAAFLKAVPLKPKVDIITFSHLLDQAVMTCNQRPIGIVPSLHRAALTPLDLTGRHSGRFVDLPGEFNDISKVYTRLSSAMDQFRHHLLQYLVPRYKKLFAKQKLATKTADVGSLVMVFDKLADGVPRIGRVTNIDTNARNCALQYINSAGNKVDTTRSFRALALICRSDHTAVTDLDPFDTKARKHTDACSCQGERFCSLGSLCLMKKARDLLEQSQEEEGASGTEASAHLPTIPEEDEDALEDVVIEQPPDLQLASDNLQHLRPLPEPEKEKVKIVRFAPADTVWRFRDVSKDISDTFSNETTPSSTLPQKFGGPVSKNYESYFGTLPFEKVAESDELPSSSPSSPPPLPSPTPGSAAPVPPSPPAAAAQSASPADSEVQMDTLFGLQPFTQSGRQIKKPKRFQ